MTKKQYMESIDRCELCGSAKKLELHHIIPIVAGGEDVLDNWLCICKTCHSKLTPSGILTKIGLRRTMQRNCLLQFNEDFYTNVNKLCDEGVVDGTDIMDAFDIEYEKFKLEMWRLIGFKRNERPYGKEDVQKVIDKFQIPLD